MFKSNKNDQPLQHDLLSNHYKITQTNDQIDEKDSEVNSDTAANTLLNSRESKDPFLNRGITFTRGFTMDTANSLRRTVTQTLGIDISDDIEEEWTRNLLETYNAAANRGVEGDIPLPAEFARNYEFWKAFIIVGLIAALLGLAALAFLNIVDYVSELVN
eukprot:gene17929-23551_t